MSKNNNVVVNAESMREALAPVAGEIVFSANKRSVWARALSRKAEKALEAAGFKYAKSRGEWYFTYEAEYKPAKFASAEPKAQAKAEKAEKVAEQPKAERKLAELPAEAAAKIMHACGMAFPGCFIQIVGTWVWVSGEATREFKDALKAKGFRWAHKKQAWFKALAA